MIHRYHIMGALKQVSESSRPEHPGYGNAQKAMTLLREALDS